MPKISTQQVASWVKIMAKRRAELCQTAWFSSSMMQNLVAIDRKSDRIIIITVYSPSRERWSNDWKRGKR